MDQPMIVVNFKTYASASGEAAETLLAAMEAHADGPATLVAVASAFDLATLAERATNVEVWSQHLDPVGLGGFTGWLEPQTALHRGAKGSIINHAEHKVELDHVRALLEMLPEGFPRLCLCRRCRRGQGSGRIESHVHRRGTSRTHRRRHLRHHR